MLKPPPKESLRDDSPPHRLSSRAWVRLRHFRRRSFWPLSTGNGTPSSVLLLLFFLFFFLADVSRTACSDDPNFTTEDEATHWAFRPLDRSIAPPPVRSGQWPRNPIDSFILSRLESASFGPAARLDPRALCRRVYFDVWGLPPRPEDVAAFVEDSRADPSGAYERLVDRLLSSRHYAERWARHWLDVARYADSDGQEGDGDRPHAYHYRDFVIRALDDDLPFDEFVRLQLAGDEIAPRDPDALAATGFLVAGPHTVLADTFLEEERLRNRYNELDDVLSTMGTGLLGLTIGCARCHDHKYDAISSREYYSILAAFHSGEREEVLFGAGEGDADASSAKSDPSASAILDATGTGTTAAPGDTKAVVPEQTILAFHDVSAEPRPTWLFERADFYDRDEPVELGFIAQLERGKTARDYWAEARERALGNVGRAGAANAADPSSGTIATNDSVPPTTYQRSALAAWITDVDHGAGVLLARVIVNRLWQHHFGEGLVRTVDDFGVRGDRPTHPELLEWLASELVSSGFHLKPIHRLILTSAAYQQGAVFDSRKASVDPENRLLSRIRPRRLDAEILRDAMLSAAGALELDAYGPAFKPPIAAEAIVARNLKTPYPADAVDSPATRRRSVYLFQKRVVPYPLFQAFDKPDSLQSCGRRVETTVPTQALALLNDSFVRRRALDFADRLLREVASASPEAIVDRAFELALSRLPRESERLASVEFLRAQNERREARGAGAEEGSSFRDALADLSQVLFGLNEFIYVD